MIAENAMNKPVIVFTAIAPIDAIAPATTPLASELPTWLRSSAFVGMCSCGKRSVS